MLLEQETVRLDLTIATEPDREKNLAPEHRHGICGVDQPPILLQEQEDGTYLVRDGHHRRLVAIARGDETIEAYVCHVGFESPSGSPFPYYWRSGEATVMWQGQEWDYGQMWGGEWRNEEPWVPQDSADCDMDECDCADCMPEESCKSQSESCKPQSEAKHVPWFLRHCYRLECCGPYREVLQSAMPSPRSLRIMQEDMGQFTLGV